MENAMDGLDPYTGYPEYDPGLSDSAIPDDVAGNRSSSKPPADDTSYVPMIASAVVSGRLAEVDLSDSGFTTPDEYITYTGYGDTPIIGVGLDPNRLALHPITTPVIPHGVRASDWKRLDADGIFHRPYDATALLELPLPYAIQEDVMTGSTVPATLSSGGGEPPIENDEEYDPTEMPFLDHLEEFRWALLKSIAVIMVSMIVGWVFSDMFYGAITRLAKQSEITLISTKLMEPIMLKVQMALVMGIILSLPFILYFLWSFVSPGLYRREKKWVLPFIYGVTGCFFIGAAVAYFIIIPFMLPFIKAFMPPDTNQMITIGDFVSKILRFAILFGAIFEMPLVAFFLAKLGILKHTWMVQYRKYAIVVIFVLGAIFTPPDPVSQVMMAVPLVLLYEVSIQVARFAGRKTIL